MRNSFGPLNNVLISFECFLWSNGSFYCILSGRPTRKRNSLRPTNKHVPSETTPRDRFRNTFGGEKISFLNDFLNSTARITPADFARRFVRMRQKIFNRTSKKNTRKYGWLLQKIILLMFPVFFRLFMCFSP